MIVFFIYDLVFEGIFIRGFELGEVNFGLFWGYMCYKFL